MIIVIGTMNEIVGSKFMSGGHFNSNNYIYYQVGQFADELETEIENNNQKDEWNYSRDFQERKLWDGLAKLKKPKFWDEESAIEWQMLLSLFMDNEVKPPKIIFATGIEAAQYLKEKCADDYNSPAARKKALNKLIKSAHSLMEK